MAGTEAERPSSPAANLWFPGKTVYPVTARAQEIAKSREELIGLLRGLPESDYELSLTDLVEKKSDLQNSVAEDKNRVVEEPKNRKLKKRSGRNCNSSGSRNSYGGVLLNVFLPVSLTRGLTRSSSSVSVRTPLDSSTRERDKEEDPAQPGCCWSLAWDRGSGSSKSRRHSAKVA